ncbi:MAG: PorV/PorQ family protein [Bacteroidales bacterium]|nr:PorV/PorQ family protein [Bacteroidales bacterium]
MRTPKLLISAAAALLMAVPSFAQGGEEALPFARTDRNPATAGKAFTGTASTSSIAWSAFSNSAVIPFYKQNFDAGLSWQNWAPDGTKSTNINAGVAYRINDFIGISAGFASQSYESYDVIDQYGMQDGTFTPKALVVNGGVGVRVADQFSIGANVRYLRQTITDGRAIDAFAGDVMLYYKPLKELGLTAGVVSVGSKVKSILGESYSLPASAKVAGDYTLDIEGNIIRADVDLDYYFSGNLTAGIGAEYGFADMVFIRAGYHYGEDKSVLPSFAAIGAGLKFYGVKLDFAYLTANKSLGNTITIGLGYSF